MLKNMLIISMLCIYFPVFSQGFSDSFSKKYLSQWIGKEGKNDEMYCYTAAFKLPLIEHVKGNAHISDIRYNESGLEIIIAWTYDAKGTYQYVKVPWKDIFSGNVNYGLAEYYTVPEFSGYCNSPPFVTLQKDSLMAENEIGYKQLNDKKIIAYKNHLIIQSKKNIKIYLPKKYTMVSFDANNKYIFLVVDSDQGYRDGELMMPFLTTQIFMLPLEF